MRSHGLLQENASLISLLIRLLDVLCVIAGALIAYYWRHYNWNLPNEYRIAVLVSCLLTIINFSIFALYNSWRGRDFFTQLRNITIAWGSVLILILIIAFVTKSSELFSRQWVFAWSIISWSLLISLRMILTIIQRVMRSHGWNQRRIIIIGTKHLTKNVEKQLKSTPWSGINILTVFDSENPDRIPTKLTQYLLQKKVDEIWFAMPFNKEESLQTYLYNLRHSTITIRLVPDFLGSRLLSRQIINIAGMPIINLNETPMIGIKRCIKALEDRCLAILILILIMPVLPLIAIGVKLSSKGPVLFKQKRNGWGGRQITIYKFRTMIIHEEKKGQITQASKSDSRVTKFGEFLRKTSLDELPQFFNVLQGRMSIVGPRPHAVAHNEYYKDLIDAYMQRHKVKPGITGWAQVNGWRGETEHINKMQRRIEHDLFYIDNWSLWFDIKIIFLTLVKGFTNFNAY
jgi:Undecaprenyl-phosphate glucose phosphotransferase